MDLMKDFCKIAVALVELAGEDMVWKRMITLQSALKAMARNTMCV